MEDDYSDTSSITTSNLGSDTASLSSSILNYQYENGRRYHAYKAGNYFGPNDDQEQDRLDILHHIHCMVLGGELYAAPVKEAQNILDVGTGTGIWAIEVADKFPDARVIATDLSAIQPGWVPPNVSFEIDDIEADWSFPCTFDFIHLRAMGGSIKDWPALLEKCMAALNPGGYIEVCDGEAWASTDDNSLPEDSGYHIWQVNLDAAGKKFGRDMNIIPYMKDMVKAAGFEDVEDHVVKVCHHTATKNVSADFSSARLTIGISTNQPNTKNGPLT